MLSACEAAALRGKAAARGGVRGWQWEGSDRDELRGDLAGGEDAEQGGANEVDGCDTAAGVSSAKRSHTLRSAQLAHQSATWRL